MKTFYMLSKELTRLQTKDNFHVFMFVRKYLSLQFDRGSEENYEEKRTRIGRPLMRANLATERHAGKI